MLKEKVEVEVIKGSADKQRDLSPFFLAAGRSFGLMRKEISRERSKVELVANCGSSLGILVCFCQ